MGLLDLAVYLDHGVIEESLALLDQEEKVDLLDLQDRLDL